MQGLPFTRRSACLLIASLPAWSTAGAAKGETKGRVWLGPEFWANTLQDWRFRNSRIECVVSGGNRNVYLLTRELASTSGTLSMKVDVARLDGDTAPLTEGFAGYRLGVKGEQNDYRDSAIYGIGLHAGITTGGQLFVGALQANAAVTGFPRNIQLSLEARPVGDAYEVRLSALGDGGTVLATITRSDVPSSWLTGGIGLICHAGRFGDSPDHASIRKTGSGPVWVNAERGGNVRFSFRNWEISGTKVSQFDDRSFGPLLWAMHTVSKGVLKLTAQFTPIEEDTQPAHLQIEQNGKWVSVASVPIDSLARTATFRIPKWPASRDVRYRVLYSWNGNDHTFEGTIRKDPSDKQKIVLASLSCLNDFGFPHRDLLKSLQFFKPDLIAFQGDQIYERAAGFGIQRFPLETAALDYLRKWYLFGWSFRDLMRDTPIICMPDDHDVFHGNVWGAGGRHAEGTGQDGQDSGGYLEPARWVNMVQRTQTSHLPDPYDPTPVDQGIGVYYTELLLGGVSFAILEDRKWKSAPRVLLPNAHIKNGWAQNPSYNAARDGDVPGAELFGTRQIHFLEAWGEDWRHGTWLKVALSQTLMANLATLPPPANTDAVVPSLPILRSGQYVEGDTLVADHDSNGWPQSGRNRALRALRRCAAVHLCGDQHLGSTVQYGIDDWGDAAYALCSPALSNLFPRRWYPSQPGKNPLSHSPRNTGDYLDGFGNKITVHAVFNPEQVDDEPHPLMDRSPGFAIVEFDRADHSTALAVWPRRTPLDGVNVRPVPGWPVKIKALENGWSKTSWVLDTVHADGRAHFCVQVRSEANHQILYTVRIKGDSFAPPVPHEQETYSVRVFDPDSGYEKVFRNLTSKAL